MGAEVAMNHYMNLSRTIPFLIAGALLTGFQPGCASSPPAQATAQKAAAGLSATRDEVIEVKKGSVRCAATLDGLMHGQGTLKERYDRFAMELQALKDQAVVVRERCASMLEKADEYFRLWDEEIAKIGDKELREKATLRRERVTAALKDVRDHLGHARDAFNPYLKELSDLEAYLHADLTDDGIAAATPRLKAAIANASTIQGPMDAAINRMEGIAKALSGTSTTTTPVSAPAK
jgi:hypothetical protein